MATAPETSRGAAQASASGGLAAWAEASGRRQGPRDGGDGLRFAFYGRVSTEDWQDPESSRARQLQQVVMLVAGRGVVVAEFFE